MNLLRLSVVLSASVLLSGCFSYMVTEKSKSIEDRLWNAHDNQMEWEPFQGSRLLRCPLLCTQGQDSAFQASVYRLDIADTALFLSIYTDAAILRDNSSCTTEDSTGQALDLVITADSIDFHPTDSGKISTARLFLDIRPSGCESGSFELRYASLLVSRHGRVRVLPVNISTNPDGTREARQAASLHQLWLFATIPADIVTSPLQLLAAPFVIPRMAAKRTGW